MSLTTDLESAVACLGESYEQWKYYEGEKNQYKDEFFELADESVTDSGLAIRLYAVRADSIDKALTRAELHNPGWRVHDIRSTDGPRAFEAMLTEEAALKPFTFEHDGVKYARTVSRGSVMLDEEWLQEEDPELFDAVTYTLPWGEVLTRPINSLDPKLIGRLDTYIYNGKPSVKLAAPRKLSDDE